MNSNLGNLNWGDAIKGLVLSVITALLSGLLTGLQSGIIDWKVVGIATVSAAIAYILKALGTDGQGNILGIGSNK